MTNAIRKSAAVTLALAMLTVVSRAADVFVECESFTELGGWVVDAYSMRGMGSAYVMAHGCGRPVADAVGSVSIPQKGLYSVWARTRNWNAEWTKGAAGLFKVKVNGAELPETLGVGDSAWQWRKAGEVSLPAGRAEVALHDLTGFNGRCDALFFTTAVLDARTVAAAAEKVRASRRGKIEDDREAWDIVVVGGGVAGCCAALSASRYKLKTLLLQDRGVLGGCNSSEIRVSAGGFMHKGPYPALGNVLEEILPVQGDYVPLPAKFYEDDRKANAFACSERTARLKLNKYVYAVETNASGRIVAVISRDTRTGRDMRHRAKWFVDATGDGVIARLAGCETMYGREERARWNEACAPVKADRQVMGHSIQWKAQNVREDVAFPDIDWSLPFTEETVRYVRGGLWWQEAGQYRDMAEETEAIRDYGLLAIFSNWNFIKNHSARRAEWRRMEIRWMSPIGGKRESHRVVGDYVLTEADLEGQRKFEDGTAVVTWDIDFHFPEPENERQFKEPFRSCAYHRGFGPPVAVPYRCLYARDAPNLFLAGRDISTSHGAFAAVRVQRTLGMLGEVVGIAAGICKEKNCDPRDVYATHLSVLKARMEKGVPKQSQYCAFGGGLHEKYHFADLGFVSIWPNPATNITPRTAAAIRSLGMVHRHPHPLVDGETVTVAAAARKTYVATFDIENKTATCGVVNVSVPGTALLNSTLPPVGEKRHVVRAFRALSPVGAGVPRMGSWQVKGEYTTSAPTLEEVTPVHDVVDGVEIGARETQFGNTYRYVADWKGRYGSEARPFVGFTGGYFHDTHWRMSKNGILTWRHELGGLKLSKAKVTLNVSHAETMWAVEAAVDGGAWRRIATFTNAQSKAEVSLPEGTNIMVRMCGAGEKGFYLWNYSFEATVGGKPCYRVGRTTLRRKDGTPFKWPDEPVKPYAKGALLSSTDGALRLWTAVAGWKVFPENPLPTERTDALQIKAAANETECAQLVVTPVRNLSGVSVALADAPKCTAGEIPRSAVEVLKVSYVDVKIPTDKTCAPGLWPDPIELQTADGCDVAAGESQAFWVRVKPSKGTKKGIYRGMLELRANGCETQKVPIEVEVFGFELPDVMTCETAFGCRTYNIDRDCRPKTLDDRRRTYDMYFRILADHHITVYNPDPTTPLKVEWKGLKDPASAVPVFNWDEWDAAIEKGFREYHANTLRIPVRGLGGGTYEHRFEPEIAGFKEGVPEYDILIGKYLSALEAHLMEKGWLDKSYVYWFDEPSPKDYAFCTNGFAKLKRYAPGLRRMITEEADRALLESVNLWCPVTCNFHKGETAAARAKGDRFWWYVCCDPKAPYATEFIDKPGTEMRVWLWQTWKEDVTGILIWDTIYWSGGSSYRGVKQDCWMDTQCWCDSARLPYPYHWGNGAGRFLYPPRKVSDGSCKGPVLDRPVETYRLEMLRDGIEDYEYFAMLRRLDPKNPLLAVPLDVTASMTDFTRDPAPLSRHRERLAREIERNTMKVQCGK